MLRRTICAAVPIVQLLAISSAFAQAPPLPAVQTTANSPNFKDGKVALEERRIRAYTYLGGDENIIRQAVQRIVRQDGDAPGGWVYEWNKLGKYYEEKGDALAKTGPRRAVVDAYMTSGVYYALAWFPRIASEEQAKAYDNQLRVYQKGGKLFDVPLEVVKVPFKDGYLTTYLHRPIGIEKPKLLIWTGGVDQYKANHYRPIQDMLARGFAVVTFDMPGFGESRQFEQIQDAAPHLAIIDYYMKRPDIDAAHINVFGQSYGGGAALRTAVLNDPRITAIVGMCAGIRSPRGKSLVDEGKVGQGKTITTPLLVVNGSRDQGNPPSDMMMLWNSAKESDIWILGLGEHCAVEYWPVVMPHVAQWLVEKNAKTAATSTR
jgi:dienelactone hydrolase